MQTRRLVGTLTALALAATTVACGSGTQAEEDGEASASQQGSSAQTSAQTYTVASGTALTLSLNQELSTDNTSEGDRFTATVASAVTQGNRVLIPEGSNVTGRITALQEATDDRPAALKLDFESIEVRGSSQPLAAHVTSAEVETRKELEGEAKKIGGGAAAGGLVGGIISGNAKGALIGAAVGAAAGTAITLGTRGQKAYLPAGAPVEIELDRSLTVRI